MATMIISAQFRFVYELLFFKKTPVTAAIFDRMPGRIDRDNPFPFFKTEELVNVIV